MWLYKLGEFIHVIGDAQIYFNHFEQVEEQLKREPKKLPTVKLNPKIKSLFDFRYEDIVLENYGPYPPIRAKVAKRRKIKKREHSELFTINHGN